MNARYVKNLASRVDCKNLITSSFKKPSGGNKSLLLNKSFSNFHTYSTLVSSSNARQISAFSSLLQNSSSSSVLFMNSSFSSFSTQTKTNQFPNNQASVAAGCNDSSVGNSSNSSVEKVENTGGISSSPATSDNSDSSSNEDSKASSNEQHKKKRKPTEPEQNEYVSETQSQQKEETVPRENEVFNMEELIKLREESKIHKHKIKELQQKIINLLQDIDLNRDRHIKELENARVYSITNFAKTMIEVADSLSLAMNTLEKENVSSNDQIRSILNGIKLTEDNFLNALGKFEITRYNPLGELFDPAYHEALFEIQDPTKPKGVVAQVIQTGFKIQDRILRAAKVGVAK